MKKYLKITIVILAIVIIAAIIIVIKTSKQSKTIPQPTEASRFTWNYQPGSPDLDGFPKTKISLTTTYKNGKTTSTRVDEVQGSCNDIDPAREDTDKVIGTTKIQCYAAGFGEWYKITKGPDSYNVLRKEFAEASPDSIPPTYTYETLVTIPLMQ